MDLASLKKRLLSSSEKEITLNHDEYKALAAAAAAPEVHAISVTLKHQRSTFRIADVDPSAMTVAFLVDEAITKWKSLSDTSFSIYSDKDFKHSVSDAYLQVCTYPRTLFVKD